MLLVASLLFSKLTDNLGQGNGHCERECGECERPTPHPVHGPICWGTTRNGIEDPNWIRNDNPDDAPVGSCGDQHNSQSVGSHCGSVPSLFLYHFSVKSGLLAAGLPCA